MESRKRMVLAFSTGLLLSISGLFIVTLGFAGRLSFEVPLETSGDHTVYVAVGCVLSLVGVVLLAYGCRLVFKIKEMENEGEELIQSTETLVFFGSKEMHCIG